jgi:cellobiose phosphorylase
MAGRFGRTERLQASIGHLTELSLRDLTHHEFHHFQTGRPGGSRTQLWSAAGYVGVILRGVLGLTLEDDLLRVRPNVPAMLGGLVDVRGIRYRDSVLEVIVRGAGQSVRSVRLDGVTRASAEIPATLRGAHVLEIELGL